MNQDRRAKNLRRKYLRVANVQRGFLELLEVAELEATDREYGEKRLSENDIVVVEGHANPLEIGRAALITSEAEGFTFQNHLFRLRSVHAEPYFACAWLNSEWMQNYWFSQSRTSSGLHTINRTMLGEVPFPLPPLEEQREIAALLQSHDTAIRAMQAEAARLRELKRGLMQGLLSGEIRTSP